MLMAFEAIVGQEKIVEILKKTLMNRSFSHAYVFEGLDGLGKKETALEFAKGIVCEDEGMKPCNFCQSCRRIENSNYPEVTFVEEDGAIKIERIREIQRDIQMRPYEGQKKVYVISGAESMTVQAQNALLKTLEEPPGYVTMILLTVNVNSLLPTIVSRCQIFKFRPVEIGKIQQALMEGRGISREESRMVASFANGIIGRAIRLLEDEDFKRRREEVLKLTEEILRSNTINILDKVDFFLKEKNHIEEVLDMLASWYRDLMVYKETQELHFMMNCDRIEEIKGQSNRIGLKKIRDIIFIIDQTKGYIKSNVNFQLNMEVMLLNIQEVLA